ncbi:MAG: hypothetical protein A2W31_10055 [Planctomycetes bacterium RBG_16_64_10]|nr:MAG: hypothetical protein A2W31_10055 [Planctomycetes bacterium RBG_16_64_10]
MVSFALTEEQRILQETARRFVEKEVTPVAAHHDETGEFPWALMQKAFDTGLINDSIPAEYGGGGLSCFETVLLAEEIAAGCAGVATSLLGNNLASTPIVLAGTEEQKRRFLGGLTSKLSFGAFGLTEPGAGSDAAGMTTMCRKDGDVYVLNGTKCFITNGGMADFHAKVPARLRLGEECERFKIAMRTLDRARPGVAALGVGVARAALEHSVRYAKERHTFGQRLANHQGLQFMLAEMARDVEVSRLATWHAAWLIDQGKDATLQSSVSKLLATDTAMKVSTDAVQLFGGYGYMKDYPVEKLMRDAKLLQIYEGTNQIQRLVIARKILGD